MILKTEKKFENEDNITKPYKVHNFTKLLILSGLLAEHIKMLEDINFNNDWWILRKWDESLRYYTGKKPKDVKDFIDSVKTILLLS